MDPKKSDAPGRIIGAVFGAALGVLAYWLAVRKGYLLLAAVALAPGLGGGLAARRRSLAWGVVLGIASVVLAIVVEWRFWPFEADGSFAYFLTHLHHLPWKSQLSLIAGLVVGCYFGMGRDRKKKEG